MHNASVKGIIAAMQVVNVIFLFHFTFVSTFTIVVALIIPHYNFLCIISSILLKN